MFGIFEGIEVGSWYRSPEGAFFEVVALDMEAETIEVQYFDGAVEELDFDSWIEMGALPQAAPNDASGALDLDGGNVGDIGLDWENTQAERLNPIDQLDWH